ncbi:MAG: UDP-N-acetylmuramoyl-tripeptide--D-alanyl-D-alanine ligase [Balneolaceae bacterium]|nr:UDP-N-acetylmuramoyl-tripeptide--D-alanyl-D-alanine ligase [Balneolaceae bacterium]MBO6545714.1 UDP-N-acetylmuramoyl-tripeptide--D-alanyl-D-alanine ligase [Balneolaceae bacterium]MBO6647110.1 UDP-N-acetylmuramoyl-tripeptide--D-alanyl-D-alanine ligase [Balneolaceae bacterium]
MHVFQQVGYKQNEYWHWLRDNWERKVIPADLAIFNLFLFGLVVGLEWLDIEITNSSTAVILFLLSFFWFGTVKKYRSEKVKKPLVFTSRMKRLTIPVVLIALFIPAFFTVWTYSGLFPFLWVSVPTYDPGLLSFDVILLVFGWIFGALLLPFLIFIGSSITKPIERSIQNGFKKQARKKIASMPHLKIIALTGSYGKTSTKFMVRDLLKERYSVCSTPGSYNTPMGICKVINNDLQSHHQILILEMGARYEGNIQELCDIAQPDISIITNVGVAHLETFGSQDVIAREKGKLVDNLKSGGVAILNADDPRVSKMGEGRPEIKRVLVGLNQGEITAGDISYDTSGSAFEVSFGEEKEQFQTRLLGAHNVQNMLLAIGAAHHLGIRPKTMAIAAKSIEPIEHRLELKQQGDIFIIDDAFNSNPVGAKNAVEILGQFKSGSRIIITPGMIELGDIEYEENKHFGRAIAKAKLDLVILVGEERAKPIKDGIEEAEESAQNVKVVNSLFEANDLVREYAKPGDVILYENDLPDVYNEG